MFRRDEGDSLEMVKRTIRATFPDVTISVLDNPNDYAGGIIYISNAPTDFKSAFSKELDFVTVPIGIGDDRGIMVIPMPYREEEAGEEVTQFE